MGCISSKDAAPRTQGGAGSPTSAVEGSGRTTPKVVKGLDYLVNCICVLVVRAGNLEHRDLVNSCEPYAKVQVGSQEYFTRVVHNELNPVFNERFSFLAPVPNPPEPFVSVSLYDRAREALGEKLGTIMYPLAETDFSLDSQSHWLPLEGARSGQAKLRVLACTYVTMKIRVGTEETEHVLFAPCLPNGNRGGPFPRASFSCASAESSSSVPQGMAYVNVQKAFSNRMKRAKTYKLDFAPAPTVAERPHLSPLAAAQLNVAKAVGRIVSSPDATASAVMETMDLGCITLPDAVLKQALSSGHIKVSISFETSAVTVDAFQAAMDAVSSVPASVGGPVPAACGAGGGASIDLSTVRTRSVGSNLGAGLPARSQGSPRSMLSSRTGQPGAAYGLGKLSETPSLAGRAAAIVRALNDTMDHVLESGPHPGSPFISSRSLQARLRSSGLSMASVGESPAATPVRSATPTSPDPYLYFHPWRYPDISIAAESSTAARQLSVLLAQVENQSCVECGAPDPAWALPTKGGFVCDACAAGHRHLNLDCPVNCYSTPEVFDSPPAAAKLATLGNTTCASNFPPPSDKITKDSIWADRIKFLQARYGSATTSLNLPDANPSGLLHVIVTKASELKNQVPASYSDPHCVVSVGSTTRKTRTIESTVEPIWNESLMGFRWNGSSPLEVQVFDRDTSLRDHAHGANFVCLHGIPSGIPQVVEAPLLGPLSGKVTLELTFQPHIA